MAKADEKGIPFEDYIKAEPEPFVRKMLDSGQLRYTWVDANGNSRASDDSGLQPPKDWWLMVSSAFDRERYSWRGLAYLKPTFPEMFFVKVFPATMPTDKSANSEGGRKFRAVQGELPKLYPPDGEVPNSDSTKTVQQKVIAALGYNVGWDTVNRVLGRDKRHDR